MDFVSRVERRILINLSRRFFLPFVIHKEGKGPLIFLPISRSNFSNTWIPFEPPPPPPFRTNSTNESCTNLVGTRLGSCVNEISREDNLGMDNSRSKSWSQGGHDEENDGHPASKILFLGSSGYPEISSPRNNPCPFLTTIPQPPGGEYFLFQALTETFPYWKSRISGEEEEGGTRELSNYKDWEGIKRTGNEGRTIGFPEPERSED